MKNVPFFRQFEVRRVLCRMLGPDVRNFVLSYNTGNPRIFYLA